MLQRNVVLGGENGANLQSKKKIAPDQSKGIKQRLTALSDVKNTLHTHSSNVSEKKCDGGKKSSGLNKKGKSSRSFAIMEENQDLVRTTSDVLDPVHECPNHFECEEANNLYETNFFEEYRLSKKEIAFFADRMRFFGIDSLPLKMPDRCISPVEDIEFKEMREYTLSDDEDDHGILTFEIPEPTFL